MRDHAKKRRVPLRADLIAALEAALPEKEALAAIKILLRPYNSLKHRIGETVTVHHVFVELTMYHACAEFGALYGYLDARMATFNSWILAAHERVSGKHDEALRVFPSARSGQDRPMQMTELRRVLDSIDLHPEAYPNVRVDLADYKPLVLAM